MERSHSLALSPDKLFPVIDATTVKRTRHFIQKHYKNDTIKNTDGNFQKITFPQPKAITVRYLLDRMVSFKNIEQALDPESHDKILFSRYTPNNYLKNPDKENQWRAEGIAGLLRSGLLKRFESSLFAFSNTLGRMIKQHKLFLKAIDKGKIISTRFLQELSADDETALEELLEESLDTENISNYDVEGLKRDVKQDLSILIKLKNNADKITRTKDEKLKKVIQELKKIVRQSQKEDKNAKRNKRKVLIFSFFADTVEWIFKFLNEEINNNPEFEEYKGRIAAIIGSDHRKASFNPGMSRESVYDFWDIAKKDILKSWMYEADPANLQPKIRKINRDVADFIRENKPSDREKQKINQALEIVESPWPIREESLLREQFNERKDEGREQEKRLMDWILGTGLEPSGSPEILPVITEEDIQLICWLAISPTIDTPQN